MKKSDRHWTSKNIPDQSGKTVIVTGANSGLGFETARVLAHKGANVIMACRNPEKAGKAAEKIRKENSTGKIIVMHLDLADLNSVRSFSKEFDKRFDSLHLLINNAGIMMPPLGRTKQGFELQLGVNHLGHFALTGLLTDILLATPGSRIVTMSSMLHKRGKIHFQDLNWEKDYNRMKAYGQSKLANLLFTYELQRKLFAAKSDTIAVAAHPGLTATNLQQYSPFFRFLNKYMAQNAEMGALPILRVATDEKIQGGEYYGPAKRMEMVGYPEKMKSHKRSYNTYNAAKLWDVSEKLTGIKYPV